jgi:AbiU2
VQDSLWEDTLLHLSRITDRPETGGRENLTIQRLPGLVTDTALATELRTLVEQAVTRSAFARKWRNRRIAHSDLALAIKEGAMPLLPEAAEASPTLSGPSMQC